VKFAMHTLTSNKPKQTRLLIGQPLQAHLYELIIRHMACVSRQL